MDSEVGKAESQRLGNYNRYTLLLGFAARHSPRRLGTYDTEKVSADDCQYY